MGGWGKYSLSGQVPWEFWPASSWAGAAEVFWSVTGVKGGLIENRLRLTHSLTLKVTWYKGPKLLKNLGISQENIPVAARLRKR